MAVPERDQRRVEVRVDPEIWEAEVGRLRTGSAARVAAERERHNLEQRGVPRAALLACAAAGEDRTRLAGELKVYVPIGDFPPSRRPFGFVFSVATDGGRPYLALTAFGERHPASGTRSVYERAHKRLHGCFPDQDRARPVAAGSSSRVQSPSHRLAPSREKHGLER